MLKVFEGGVNYKMWHSVQSSIQGKSHIEQNIPCQDKTFIYNDDDISVFSLSDGAGSAKYSHFSAEKLTQEIAYFIKDNYNSLYSENPNNTKTLIFSIIDKCLSELKHTHSCENHDLSATLLCVAIKNNSFICFHIGDGVIGCLDQDELKPISLPSNGEFVNTTSFVTSKNRESEIRIVKNELNAIEGFFLMSDGSAEGLFHKKTRQFSPAIKKLIVYCNLMPLEKLSEEITQSLKNTLSKITKDDCSLIISAKRKTPYLLYSQMSKDERKDFLDIKSYKNWEKKLDLYNKILFLSQDFISVKSLSRQTHIKPKYLKKYTNKLLSLQLITRKHSKIKTLMENTI